MASIEEFEDLCQKLYNPGNNPHFTNEISAKLSGFKEPQKIPQLRAIFQQSNNQYALFFSAQALRDIITKKWNEIPKEEKEKLSKYLII